MIHVWNRQRGLADETTARLPNSSFRVFLRCVLWSITLAAQAFSVASASTTSSGIVPCAAGAPITGVAPITEQDILARAEEELHRVAQATDLLRGPEPVAPLRKSLDDIARPVNDRLRATAGMPLTNLSVMRLESLARHWEFDRRRFERWEAHARQSLAPYGKAALQISRGRAAWSATRAKGPADGLPPLFSDRVDAVIAQLDATEAALGTMLEQQFALSRRASELKIRIDTGQQEVAAAIDNIDRRLLAIDAPPLWQGIGTAAQSEAALDAVRDGMEIERRFALEYNAEGTANQHALLALQCLLLPLILWLVARSRRSRGASADPGASPQVLRRPISIWLLLSMLLVLTLEPGAPLLVQEFALALTIVPVLRLMRT